MSSKKVIFIICFILSIGILVYAADGELRGSHLENEMTCADCHSTDNPEGEASEDACISCHSDMTDSGYVAFVEEDGHELNHPPHDSHVAPLECTDCHKIHDESVLYCNRCHWFENKVP